MPKHGHQHWVNQSYLAAWIDPATPEGQDGYIWKFPRNGGEGKNKAPKNVFYETDLYTIHLKNGERDVRIEKSLSMVESMFAKVRAGPIAARKPLTDDDRAALCVFVAANLFRTKKQRDHLRGQFEHMLKLGKQLTERMRAKQKQLSPKDYERYSRETAQSGPRDKSTTLDMEEVQTLAEKPLQYLMWPQIQSYSSELYEMTLSFATTTDSTGFITSDAPTVVRKFGLEGVPLHLHPPGFQAPGTEVMMPISPDVIAIFHWGEHRREYASVSKADVDQCNAVACYYADEEIVVRHNRTRKIWFRGALANPTPTEKSHGRLI